jgi:ferredoxin
MARLKVTYEAHLYRAQKEVELADSSEGRNLMDSVESLGMKLPYGCRAGSCGICRVEVLSGMEYLEEKNFVEEDTLERCADPSHVRLACQLRVKAGASGIISLKKAPEII